MARRTGVPTLLRVIRELCKYLAVFTPLIKTLFPSETNLHTKLDELNALCSAIVPLLEDIREYGD